MKYKLRNNKSNKMYKKVENKYKIISKEIMYTFL